MVDRAVLHRVWDKWSSSSIAGSGKPLKGAAVVNLAPDRPARFSALVIEQEGLSLKTAEVRPVVEGIQNNTLQSNYFSIGSSKYLVTTVLEQWYYARCVNTTHASGAGALITRTLSYIIIATYQGGLGAASKAVAALDAFIEQLIPRVA